MEVFAEFFMESDLRFFGIVIILIAFIIPVRKDKVQKNTAIAMVALGVYILSELLMNFFGYNYAITFFSLFVGGIALSVFAGRLFKLLLRVLKDTVTKN